MTGGFLYTGEGYFKNTLSLLKKGPLSTNTKPPVLLKTIFLFKNTTRDNLFPGESKGMRIEKTHVF